MSERGGAAAPAAGGQTVRLVSVDGLPLDSRVHRPTSRPPGSELGSVVLVHGIDTDLDEGGMYQRLANQLAGIGFGVVRFSFRGHGASEGTQRGVTIAGEMLDLDAAVSRARAEFPGPYVLLASSFGAVSALESLRYLQPDQLVLWNPILDLTKTFIKPELPWGQANFGPAQWAAAMAGGTLVIDESFEVGRTMLTELSRYEPSQAFLNSTMPALVVHGQLDTYVSYDIAHEAARTRAAHAPTDFHTVAGSDHGFDSREREDEAIAVTVEWLSRHHAATPVS
jgi:alpha-beta hydrolase superfamily lysophospholipase